MAKYILYTFTGSVWASAPELATHELGYDKRDIETRLINLAQGENLLPAFLNINPNGTLPAMEADGQIFTNTTDVVAHLVERAPLKVAAGNAEFIAELHDAQYDPNFARLLARNDKELSQKAAKFVSSFVKNRQEVLLQISATEEAAAYRCFYDAKLAQNSKLLAIFNGSAATHVTESFYQKSEDHAAHIRSYILDILPSHLQGTLFIGGETPGESDFHLAAWLTRIISVSGAESAASGLKALEDYLGKPVPLEVGEYWNAWISRTSWKAVYANGLH